MPTKNNKEARPEKNWSCSQFATLLCSQHCGGFAQRVPFFFFSSKHDTWDSCQRVQSLAHQRIFFLLMWELCWQTPSGLPCVFYEGVASVWPLEHTGQIGGVPQGCCPFGKVLLSSHKGPLDHRVLGHLTKALPPRLFSLDGRPALGRVLQELLSFTDDGVHCTHRNHQSSKVELFPRFVPQNKPVSAVYTQLFWLHAWFVLCHAPSPVGSYVDK